MAIGMSVSGGNAFGSRPGRVAMPNPFSDLSNVYPNLSNTNAQLSSNIAAQLRGELSPETIAALRDNAATFGVNSGMPGSQFQANYGLRSLGLAREGQVQKGISNYNQTIPTVSATQTVNPAIQADVNATNVINAAAPDPAAAASYAQSLFEKYLERISGSSGSAGVSSGAGSSPRRMQAIGWGLDNPTRNFA